MKIYLYLINDFAHDFFTGLWLSCLLVLWMIAQQTTAADSVLAASLLGTFFSLQSWSMLLIMVTGIGRYWHVKNSPKQGHDKARRSLLIIKHVIMGVFFVGGTVLGYSLSIS